MFGNWLKTGILMAGIVALFGAVGGAIGGQQGMLIALVLGGAMNLFAYWFSDRLVLRMYNAQEVDETSAPQLSRHGGDSRAAPATDAARVSDRRSATQRVRDRAQPDGGGGRHHRHLQLLTPRSCAGHGARAAHVKHRDILISTISATVAGAISTLANFGMFFSGSQNRENGGNPLLAILVMILAPIAAMLIQFAISRTREIGADRRGAAISGDPHALADALAKIDAYARGIPMPSAEAQPATAQMMIINPLSGGGLKGLFSTHPATEERIARLRAMG
jgi:heat shock protein HtpX